MTPIWITALELTLCLLGCVRTYTPATPQADPDVARRLREAA